MKVFGRHDERVVAQLQRCMDAEEGALGVLCADGHLGYSQPIGGAVAYRDHVSVEGVGYDIGCGNKAVLTDLGADELRGSLPAVMDEIQRRISFGTGGENPEPADHEVLDAIRESPVATQRELYDLAAGQLGTVGGGNHYVDLFADERNRVWVGVHFGSRGFGHRTATAFLPEKKKGGMESPPALLDVSTEHGQSYVEAMQLAGEYAYAGRDLVAAKVVEILGASAVEEVHNHHNFAWRECHASEEWWVVRKGCTPAFPGQRGFVGSTMLGVSVVLEGVESEEGEEALYSTVHGAGRALSRRAAKRDIDFGTVREELRAAGVELRGGAADEAPGAYKDLREVLAAHGDTVRVLHELRPMGVAMAGR